MKPRPSVGLRQRPSAIKAGQEGARRHRTTALRLGNTIVGFTCYTFISVKTIDSSSIGQAQSAARARVCDLVPSISAPSLLSVVDIN